MRSTVFITAALLSVLTVGNNSFARDSLSVSEAGSKSVSRDFFGLSVKLSDYSKQDDCEHLRTALKQREELLSEFYYLAHQPPERLTEEEKQFLEMIDAAKVITSISQIRALLRAKGC